MIELTDLDSLACRTWLTFTAGDALAMAQCWKQDEIGKRQTFTATSSQSISRASKSIKKTS